MLDDFLDPLVSCFVYWQFSLRVESKKKKHKQIGHLKEVVFIKWS